MLKHYLTTLDSGLTVIRIPMASVASATVLVLANTGSRYEQSSQYGIAHFFEHMVFKGTEQYPDAQALAAVVDSVGADFNAFTGKEYTGYYVKAASEHLQLAVEVVSDMIMTPKLRQEDIDREKGVIIEELNMYVDTPARHIGNLFDQMMFSSSGLGHDIIGTKDTINSMTSDDFHGFLNQWYGLGNIVVMVAGDASLVDDPALLTNIETAFNKGDAATRASGKAPVIDQLNETEKSPISDQKLLVEYRKTEQAHFVMGWPGLARTDSDRYALSVLSVILGGNMSSRLFTEVREKRGLCYYVHSDTDMYHNTGVFGASAGVDPSRVEEAIKVSIDQFTGLVTGQGSPISGQEVAKAKAYIAGKLALGLEDSESVAQYFGLKHILEGQIKTPEMVLELIDAVTLEEVQGVAQRLIQPGQLRFGIIGPFKDKSVFEQLRAAG